MHRFKNLFAFYKENTLYIFLRERGDSACLTLDPLTKECI